MVIVRCLLSLVPVHGWCLVQLGVNNAFLNRKLIEEVYMTVPLGFGTKEESWVRRL